MFFEKKKKSKNFGSLRKFFLLYNTWKTEQKLFLEKKNLFLKKNFVSLKKIASEILWSEVWKVGFQFMLILGLLGVYFDAAVVFVTKSSLLFRLAVAILWILMSSCQSKRPNYSKRGICFLGIWKNRYVTLSEHFEGPGLRILYIGYYTDYIGIWIL